MSTKFSIKHGRWCWVIHKRGLRRLGPVLSSHDKNGGSYKKKTEVVKGFFCRAWEGLLLPEKLVGKQSKGCGYEIKRYLEMVTALVCRDLMVVP